MMKKLFAAALLIAALLSTSASGQSGQEARDLFKSYAATGSKGKPGALIRIELLRNGKRAFVSPDSIFHDGDKVKLHFEVNFPAYIEIYNRGSSGQLNRLFPYADSTAPVKIRTGYVIPSRADEWFEFDQTPGSEQLSFIFSEMKITPARKPVKRYEPGVIVNDNSKPAENKQLSINELNNRALDEGRDLNRVKVNNEQYVFSEPQHLRRVLGVMVTLNHR